MLEGLFEAVPWGWVLVVIGTLLVLWALLGIGRTVLEWYLLNYFGLDLTEFPEADKLYQKAVATAAQQAVLRLCRRGLWLLSHAEIDRVSAAPLIELFERCGEQTIVEVRSHRLHLPDEVGTLLATPKAQDLSFRSQWDTFRKEWHKLSLRVSLLALFIDIHPVEAPKKTPRL